VQRDLRCTRTEMEAVGQSSTHWDGSTGLRHTVAGQSKWEAEGMGNSRERRKGADTAAQEEEACAHEGRRGCGACPGGGRRGGGAEG
jgi:hypothetical protein